MELLEQLVEGRSYRQVHEELYESGTAQSKTHMDMEKVLNGEGQIKQRYRSDIETFLKGLMEKLSRNELDTTL